jgi:putative transposase
LGVVEGTKEDAASWRNFLRHLKERGLQSVRLLISDKCLGLVEAVGEFYPQASLQRCKVHWYRNVMSVVPKGKVKEVMAMLKAIHAQEDRQAARDKAGLVVEKLEALRLSQAAAMVRQGVDETLSYMALASAAKVDRHKRSMCALRRQLCVNEESECDQRSSQLIEG